MNNQYIESIAADLELKAHQVSAVVRLFEDEATVPFIARYRKEATGGLDEVAIIAIRDMLKSLEAIDKRKAAIIKSMTDHGQLNEELETRIKNAKSLTELEDIYLPFRPKRRTRGIIAREKGLEDLAHLIYDLESDDLDEQAVKYVSEEKGVLTLEDALAGARDIIAEWISEDPMVRADMRHFFEEDAVISTTVIKAKEQRAGKYRDYFSWSEHVASVPGHRVLAALRGAEEGYLTLHIRPDEGTAVQMLTKGFVHQENEAGRQLGISVEDAYKRLIAPSLENEMKNKLKKEADAEAIDVFARNVRELLLTSPLGEKAVLALDPGLKTGCKLVCLSPQGELIHTDTVYPLPPRRKTDEAATKIRDYIRKYKIEAVAVGNGTGGRETFSFLRELSLDIPVVMVNEAGASIYSASPVAREEFPDFDVTVRGAISIGRRLMDPLAELVKIDPKSIGVGQYQHDVNQKAMKETLDDVVVSCVNAVGVELNTASRELLKYVSGLSEKTAKAIVEYREANGPFKKRDELLSVAGIGEKSFEQSAGFLRIRNGENPLDRTAVHPENYPLVERIAGDLGCTTGELLGNAGLNKKIDPSAYVTEETGLVTIEDIIAELERPGLDPREEFDPVAFADGVHDIKDLETGMVLPGVVTNVTNFGAFVDIGVHQDGLVHISELANFYVKDPHDVVKVNQQVKVRVIEIDKDRKRIALSMKDTE
ncbi:MAG: RNA-binding transcriptional accessory protein [Spirochaetales bacterium]|nr:RNA-binding transcriptional accessory protein [Spirochaetales bacterium]